MVKPTYQQLQLHNQHWHDCYFAASDGKGNEMLLARVEAWTHGGSSAAAHLRLVCYLLQSSLAAERQLFEDSSLAARSVCTLSISFSLCLGKVQKTQSLQRKKYKVQIIGLYCCKCVWLVQCSTLLSFEDVLAVPLHTGLRCLLQ